ncbi:exosortase E/protease, VPEID-CTERM system [bacterium]|nr:exosortase E/protease, VPEID-CTERM system [bacterium]
MKIMTAANQKGMGVLAWVAVLFIESEYLAVRNYALRTEIRALLRIPLYHLTFSFLAFALFLYHLQASRLGPLHLGPWRWRRGLLHGLVFAATVGLLHPLENGLQGSAPAWKLVAWSPLLLVFAGTWAGAILAPARWWSWLRMHSPWLAIALLLAGLSLGVIHVSNWLWHPLADGTLYLAHLLLLGIYDDVMVSYANYTLGTGTFQILIEPGCSGYEGLGLVSLFTLTFLWLRRADLSFPLALLLLPFGWALTWVINGLRIATLVVIGTSFSADLAMKGFHSQAGWLAFVATSGMLVMAVEQAGWFLPDTSAAESREPQAYPAAVYLLPLLAILLGTMLGSAFSTGFPLLYPLRIVLALGALGPWWHHYPGMLGRFVSLRAVLSGVIVYILWVMLVPGGPAPMVWGMLSPGLAWAWVAVRLLGSSLIVPLVEELAFRGYLMRRLQSSYFEQVQPDQVGWKAWLLSSLAFGMLHQDALAAFLAGLIYGQLVRKGGSLGEAVLAHGLTNLLICVQVLWLGHWSLW